MYNVVPSGVLINSPDYSNLLLLMPQAVGMTRVENYMLTRTEPDDRLREKWDRSLVLTDEKAFPEDFMAARLSYEGLASGAIEHILIGGMEEAIRLYHRSLDQLMQF